MALKSLITRAASAGRQAARKALPGDQQTGWSDGWHTQASTTDSLRLLRDSAVGVAKSTTQTATTREGWRRIARSAAKVSAGTVTLAAGIAASTASSTDVPASNAASDPYAEGWQDGPDGFGYYSGGLRVDD